MNVTPPRTCSCGCAESGAARVHAIVSALDDGDLDRAIEAGLLDPETCTGCAPSCRAKLLSARKSRLDALAARERYRARNARLARRARERDLQRAAARPSEDAPAPAQSPSLPSAAAAALSRALARASERRKS